MQFLTNLKTKWSYKLFLILLLFLSVRLTLALKKDHLDSHYSLATTEIEGTIVSKKVEGDRLTMVVSAKEKVNVTYFLSSKEEKDYFKKMSLGDKIKVEGKIKRPADARIFHLFSYRHYLMSQNISWTMEAKHLIKKANNRNPFFFLKQQAIVQIEKHPKTKEYLYAFLLGENSYLKEEEKEWFREIGISHLFAVSGMHVSLLSSFFLFLLSFVWKNKKGVFLLLCLFLLFYLFLTNFSPSILRATFFFFLGHSEVLFPIKLSKKAIFFFVLFLLLWYQPFYVYHLGFLFSFLTSYSLIAFSSKEKKSYWKGLLETSFLAFCASFPLVLSTSFELSFFSIFFNLLFVPLVSFVLFPLCFLTFFLPFFDPLLFTCLTAMEFLVEIGQSIQIFHLSFASFSPFLPIFYSMIVMFSLHQRKRKKYGGFILLAVLLVFHSQWLFFQNDYRMIMIDIGQGDSILFLLPHGKSVLVDTGGKTFYSKEEWQKGKEPFSIAKKQLIPLFKSLGMTKLDRLILSHGDMDHAGEAKALIENFPVTKVIMNAGNDNSLEKEIQNLLKNKKIPYEKVSLGKETIGKTNFWFLNPLNKMDENQDSLIIYTKLNQWNILLMGDASIVNENRLLEEYNLPTMDILKIGHHGSSTSTSEAFLNSVKPKIALISVGVNNRYHHPSEETIQKLQFRDIVTYQTSTNGSIELRLKKHLKIRTCLP